ncbi:preprotein translocase subunit SecA [Streptococcus pneumoniae]|nr:preprotein translocase subunit SecA [Streptococcus pneumoniae]
MFRRLGQDFQLRKVKKILKQINALKGKMSSLSDQELVAKTVEFRQRLSREKV